MPATSDEFSFTLDGRTQTLSRPTALVQRHAELRVLGDSLWRSRLSQAGTLPRLARRTPPSWSDHIIESLASFRPDLVFVQRSYLAPLGLRLAEWSGARTIVDLDDDDASVFRQLGDETEAVAYERLVGSFASCFDVVTFASGIECAHITERHRLPRSVTIPNSVEIPMRLTDIPPALDGVGKVVMVGNFFYKPNVDALQWLVNAARTLFQQTCHEGVERLEITAVGRCMNPTELRPLDASGRVWLRTTGAVADVSPWYEQSHVVAVPLLVGGGTRIKAIEALAYGRPVVATSVGVAGLTLSSGHDCLIANDPIEFTQLLVRAIVEQPLISRLVAAGRVTSSETYSAPIVRQMVGSMVRSLL